MTHFNSRVPAVARNNGDYASRSPSLLLVTLAAPVFMTGCRLFGWQDGGEPELPPAESVLELLQAGDYQVQWPPEDGVDPGQVWDHLPSGSGRDLVTMLELEASPVSGEESDESGSGIGVKAGTAYRAGDLLRLSVKDSGLRLGSEEIDSTRIEFDEVRVRRAPLDKVVSSYQKRRFELGRYRDPRVLLACIQCRGGRITGKAGVIEGFALGWSEFVVNAQVDTREGRSSFRVIEFPADTWMTIAVDWRPEEDLPLGEKPEDPEAVASFLRDKYSETFVVGIGELLATQYEVLDDAIFVGLIKFFELELTFVRGACEQMKLDSAARKNEAALSNIIRGCIRRLRKLQGKGVEDWRIVVGELRSASSAIRMRESWFERRHDASRGFSRIGVEEDPAQRVPRDL